MPLQNCFGVRAVEQARRDARHNIRAEGTAARIARSKLQLMRQISERAGFERFRHLGLQTKLDVIKSCECKRLLQSRHNRYS